MQVAIQDQPVPTNDSSELDQDQDQLAPNGQACWKHV